MNFTFAILLCRVKKLCGISNSNFSLTYFALGHFFAPRVVTGRYLMLVMVLPFEIYLVNVISYICMYMYLMFFLNCLIFFNITSKNII